MDIGGNAHLHILYWTRVIQISPAFFSAAFLSRCFELCERGGFPALEL